MSRFTPSRGGGRSAPPTRSPAVHGRSFDSLYRHGYVRVAVAAPHLRRAEPEFNCARTLALAARASADGAAVVIFPELGISAYAIDDLLHQEALLGAVREALARLVVQSRALLPVVVVGAPLQHEGGLFNTAVVIHRGRVLGVVPKSYLPEYREYYEKRQFRAARDAIGGYVELLEEPVPFGADLLFTCSDYSNFVLHVEICEDLWTPIPPSTYGAMAGASVLANLSASNITVGKADYRHQLCASQSARTIAAYLYAAAGSGESTTDLAWDGQALIYENGDLLAQAERFARHEELIVADIDLDRIMADRASMSSYADSIHDHIASLQRMRRIAFDLGAPTRAKRAALRRHIARFPYVPVDAESLHRHCEEVYNIQVQGLETRLRATQIEKVVIGVSGGLDSTHALIVATRTLDRLGLPRSNLLAYSMPGFATSQHTLKNARALMHALGVTAHELDIRPSAAQMLRDLRHPAARGDPVYDVTYENVQAGERTSHLFRLANHHRGLVLGTGDLTELALGWSTYGVGDHMSHYNVNASVPKTLVQFLIAWAIATEQCDPQTAEVLPSILATAISPELIPGHNAQNGPSQCSEEIVGPFELADFFLYYTVRFGYRPSKVAFLARRAWSDLTVGIWPGLISQERRRAYSLTEIKHWMGVFLHRFFQTSQYKRSAMPNGPKVGSGGSLSPRGDWRAPSDSTAAVWLRELEHNVPDE